jgi:MarR family transcriptional regulator, transcriptional regulator for hemolysin
MNANKPDARERFTQSLVHLARRWRWCLDRRLRGSGLTQARWTALLQIARGGEGLAQHQLADFIGIESATLVPILDSLATRKLVERRTDASDRRAKTVHLTAQAAPVVSEIEQIANDLRRELTSGIPLEDLATCVRVFEQIQARIPTAARPAESP